MPAVDHAWRGSDFRGKADVAVALAARQRDALLRATAHARSTGTPVEMLRREDFPLADIAGDIEALRQEVLNGRGVVILQGMPIEDLDVDGAAVMFWGLGTHLGRAVSQSLMGDRIGHVTDVSRDNPHERGYRSRNELSFHTDSDDIVAMLCLRQARSGGLSRFASALAVRAQIERESPHLMPLLEHGLRYHWRGEQAPGEPPITDYPVPVFSTLAGRLSCVFLRRFMEMAAEDLQQPLSALQREALDAVERIALQNALELRLSPGDAFLINNLTVLHSRTEFVDHADPARRRHLLRLWLKCDDARPRVDAVRRFYRDDGIEARDGGSTLFVHRAS